MAETLKYNALITPEELKADAINSLNFDPTDTNSQSGLGASYNDVAIRVIHSVSAAIEQYLERSVIIKRYNEDIESYKWNFNKALNKWQHYSRHFPIVEIETANVSISNDKIRMLAGSKIDEIDYFAGYRRADQDLPKLQGAAAGEGDLPDLDTLPEVLPYDINRVAFRLCMYEIAQAKQNSFGVQTRTQNVGQTETQITKERDDVYADELSKIHGYKYGGF